MQSKFSPFLECLQTEKFSVLLDALLDFESLLSRSKALIYYSKTATNKSLQQHSKEYLIFCRVFLVYICLPCAYLLDICLVFAVFYTFFDGFLMDSPTLFSHPLFSAQHTFFTQKVLNFVGAQNGELLVCISGFSLNQGWV